MFYSPNTNWASLIPLELFQYLGIQGWIVSPECEFLKQSLVSWFPAENSPIWPHVLGFISGFLGGDLPLLWTLHHWRGGISELHLRFASGLFVKHNCLPGPESSLDSEKVKFYLIIVFYLNNPDGWSLLEILDCESHCPKDEQSPGLGFVGKIFVSVLEAVGIWRQDVGAGAAPCHSLLNHYCIHSPLPFPQPFFDLVGILTRSLLHCVWQKPNSD